MIGLMVQVLVLCLVFGLLLYLVQMLPLPEPFGNVARVVIIIVGVLLLIGMLLDVSGLGGGHFRVLRW